MRSTISLAMACLATIEANSVLVLAVLGTFWLMLRESRGLMQRGVLRMQDAVPETCLAVAPVEYNPARRGQQGTIPTCTAPGCPSPCQHFKCSRSRCNKHCNRIIMSDGRPVAVWCMNHTEFPMMFSASIGQQYMEKGSVPQCSECGTFHEVIGCNYEGCSLGWCPSHSI
eukprot:6459445-Amphidinium_carterae.1